jgi:hypothetical protein
MQLEIQQVEAEVIQPQAPVQITNRLQLLLAQIKANNI